MFSGNTAARKNKIYPNYAIEKLLNYAILLIEEIIMICTTLNFWKILFLRMFFLFLSYK